MMQYFKKYFILLFVLVLCLTLVSVSISIHHQGIGKTDGTLEQILSTGKLRLITANALNIYYDYEGKPTGFEYDLALEFAKYLNVELDVVTPGWNNMFAYLDQGKGDFIAAGLTITKKRLKQAAFSIPYMTIQQHIIHHNLVFGPKNIDDLMYRTFHVRRGTPYHFRLEKIEASGIDLNYILHDNIATEELIDMVNRREIRFTIANSNIALMNQRYYPDIRIGIPIQEPESLAWAVRKDDIDMIAEINRFFLHANENSILRNITAKYYENTQNFDVYELKKFHERVETRLPKYQKIIREKSEKYGFDWRLVAAVAYQESHFNPKARSVTNVGGLMQVTDAVAREMGISNRMNPAQSIKAGIGYLNRMYQKFGHIEDSYQRMLFSLASYNIGYGHVQDALKIAETKGLDTTTWQSLRTCLPLLSKPQYFKTTQHGYARGWEPVEYVERILTYFDILKQKTMASE